MKELLRTWNPISVAVLGITALVVLSVAIVMADPEVKEDVAATTTTEKVTTTTEKVTTTTEKPTTTTAKPTTTTTTAPPTTTTAAPMGERELAALTASLVWADTSFSDRADLCFGVEMWEDLGLDVFKEGFTSQITEMDPEVAWEAFVNESRNWC